MNCPIAEPQKPWLIRLLSTIPNILNRPVCVVVGRVPIDLPRHPDLKAGTFAKGQFELGQSTALTVPAPSVVVRDGHNYVFVIGPDSKAMQRKVETGRRVAERVEVLEGLKPDEPVAVQGAGFLNEGDLVKVTQ